MLTVLARGGMSTVYLARHVLIDRLSALKLLRRDLCDDPVQRDRFLREARAVNRINHDNIVSIVDYGESEDGRVFLVMEYLPGESLHQRIARGPVDPIRALDIAAQVCAGLGRAHQMGVVHRDLKPDNILLARAESGEERVKILDFGIAKLLDQPGLTASDRVFGTPGYIAPEYAAGGQIDGRSDLYSLGVVLYELVTGALPFDAEYPADLLLKHVMEPPIPPRQRNPSLPAEVERVVLQALAKNPAERYRDAHHMMEELLRVRSALLAQQSNPVDTEHKTLPPTQLQPTLPSIQTSAVGVSPPLPGEGVSLGMVESWLGWLQRQEVDLIARPSSPEASALFERLRSIGRDLQELVGHVEQLKSRMLELEGRGRTFRSNIGRALDTLAGDLSGRARERDMLSAQRETLEQQREDANNAAQRRDPGADAAIDAVLWKLAVCDEVLRAEVGACEDLEFQITELNSQLERLNSQLEADQSALVEEIDAAVSELGSYDQQLRELAERFMSLRQSLVP